MLTAGQVSNVEDINPLEIDYIPSFIQDKLSEAEYYAASTSSNATIEREASRENARRLRNGGSPMTSRQFADMVDSVAEGWLAENARHYGFRFIQGRWR